MKKFMLLSLLLSLFSQSYGLHCSVKEQMGAVKDQGLRGTCTLFAINAFYERYVKERLSEQCMIMSNRQTAKNIDQRRNFSYVFEYYLDKGLVSKKGCPYKYKGFLGRFFDSSISEADYRNYAQKSDIDISSLYLTRYPSVDQWSRPYNVVEAIKLSIKQGNPVVADVFFPDSWSSHKGKIAVGLDKLKESEVSYKKKLGRHAIVFVAFDDDTKSLTFQNSWGKSWGYKGYGKMTYDYFIWANHGGEFLYTLQNNWQGDFCR